MSGQTLRRSVRDVSRLRLTLGLLLAPALPALIGLPLVGFPRGDFGNPDTWFLWISATLLAFPWALLMGGVYLLRKRRRDALIERAECLAVGGALGAILPSVHITVWLNTSWYLGHYVGEMGVMLGILAALFGGMLLIPFGILGGWTFWRFAIRPAALPVENLAEAF